MADYDFDTKTRFGGVGKNTEAEQLGKIPAAAANPGGLAPTSAADPMDFTAPSRFAAARSEEPAAAAPTGEGQNSYLRGAGKVANSFLGKLAIDTAAMGGGATAGAAIGAAGGPLAPITVPLGAAIGMGLGGGMAEAAQTELGRYAGDYNKSANEQVRDIGKAAFISMLGGKLIKDLATPMLGTGAAIGETIAKSKAAPDIDALIKRASDGTPGEIVRTAKHIAQNATETGRHLLAEAYSTVTGKTYSAFQTLFEDAGEVMRRSNRYINAAGKDRAAAQAGAAKDTITTVESLLDEGAKRLPQMWKQGMDDLMSSKEAAALSFHMGDVLTPAKNAIEEAGLGRLVMKKGGLQFVPFSPESAALTRQAGGKAEVISEEALTAARELTTKLDSYVRMGNVRGKTAANALSDLNKEINGLVNKYANSADPALKAIVQKTGAAYKNGIAEQFDKVGLKGRYQEIQDLYDKHGDAVKMARKLLAEDGGAEKLAAKMAAGSVKLGAKTQTTDDMVNSLRQLLGKRGDDLLAEIRMKDAARQFITWLPENATRRIGAAVLGGGATAKAAAINPILGVATAAGSIAASSPRTAGYLAKGMQFLGSQDTTRLLKDDRALAEFIKILGEGPAEEAYARRLILEKNGLSDGK